MREFLAPDTVTTDYWHELDDGRIQCDVCPRACKLKEGQRGLCFVRERRDNQIVLSSWGRSSGFCVDPIEKKPLNHYLPGTPVLSFGTAGCNLFCKFCQNWDISKSREIDTLADQAHPETLAKAAEYFGCRNIAFTYNDPVIFMEYAMDAAAACRERGINTVAVTAAYINEAPRREFFDHIDAANIDLKAFTEHFYRKLTGSSLAPVLDTIQYLHHETAVWYELTTLLIPGWNDAGDKIRELAAWVRDTLSRDVPVHFTAFHPDFKMPDTPPTPPETLIFARGIARDEGLRYVYTGNVHDNQGGSTYCPACGHILIERDWYELGRWGLDDNGHCARCGTGIPGVFEGQPGTWGRQRQPVPLWAFADHQ